MGFLALVLFFSGIVCWCLAELIRALCHVLTVFAAQMKLLGVLLVLCCAATVFGCKLNEICSNSCAFANNGDCDDGGPGSRTASCDYGTDCADCGQRGMLLLLVFASFISPSLRRH